MQSHIAVDSKERARARRWEIRHVLEWLILAAVLAVLGCYVVFTIRHDYVATERGEFARLLSQTTVIEKNLLMFFGTITLFSTLSLFFYQRRQRVYTRQARAQDQALRNSEARLHSFFDSTPDALLISDAAGNITMANRQVEKLLGYTTEELLRMSIESLVPMRSRANHPALRTAFTDNPSARRMGQGVEVRARRKDGTECDVEISLSRIHTEEGQFFASALRDITQRKYADEQLRIAAVSFESHQGVVVTDAAMVILRVNGAFTKITGYSAEELVGRKMSFLNSHRHDKQFWQDVWATIHGTQKWEGEVWNRNKAGEIHPHALTIAAVMDGNGQVTHYIGTYTDISDRKRIEEDLVLSEARLRTIIESEPQCIKIVSPDGRLKQINPAGLAMMEADCLEQVVGSTFIDWVTPEFRQAYADLHARVLAGETVQLKFEIVGLKGTRRYMQTHAVPMQDQGRVVHLAVTRDVTAEHMAEAELRIAAAAFESQESMLITDANSTILRVNRAFTEITGYSAEEVVGLTPRILKSDRHPESFYRNMWECIHRTGVWHGEIWDRRKNGEVYPKWMTISAVRSSGGVVTHYIGTAYDITERKRAEEKINELAFFDQLTGLPNRTLLLDRLRQVVAGNNRSKNFSSLLFIDLDNFKTLNDTLGHDMGDRLLKQVAQRLGLCVRNGDTVARLGGDEFVIVLKNVGTTDLEAASGTEVVAEKVLASLNQPYLLGDISHRSTSSIGATVFNGNASAIDELMKQADLAMYKSKSAGRNAFRFFDPSMEAVVKERAALEDDLVQAMSLNQFSLHYQAQIEGAGHVSGAEVLLRWTHPVRGMVSPGEFIPLAEETGLILKLGDWVLRTACCQLALWATQDPMRHLTIAVNVSAHQFRQANFVEQVIQVLEETGANPRRLKMELTESLLIDNVQDIITKMVALKASGVGFSLDDFGTGYSSLSYLKRLPLDQLKIDQSFVRDVLTDPNDASIAKTIVALAASLGLNVIAEGVETIEQRDFLASVGCEAYQGYLFSKPVTVAAFEVYAIASFMQAGHSPSASASPVD